MENSKDRKPRIEVLYGPGFLDIAELVAYGIEEEGIPFHIKESQEEIEGEALKFAKQENLGVTIAISEKRMAVYYRNFRGNDPFLEYLEKSPKIARKAGQNAAKIVKNKPLTF